ncbi:hypothetical protein C8J57DRAFT_1236259 [Mycena rebaudengoi]|nr:hypothetical protein C8J57DRAFT_1236259 [Mycena rebaudengoi]
MPDKVYKIDIDSPLIHYEGKWGPGPDNDPKKNKVFKTFARYDKDSHVFCAFNEVCSATLEFTGREIHVVGAYRPGFSGPIQVELDGKLSGPLVPEQTEQFQIDLFKATDLQPGMHTLKLSTVPSTDKNVKTTFTWTSEVASLSDTRIQDDDAAFVYEPQDTWKTDLKFLPGFDDGNGQQVRYAVSEGTATFTFSVWTHSLARYFVLRMVQGDRIALVGAIGPGGGAFTAQVDNGPVWNLTMQNEKYSAEQVIFSADGFSSGNHTVKVVAQPGAKQVVALDYAIVDAKANGNTVTSASAPQSGSPGSSTAPPSSFRAAKKGSLNPAQIGGVAAGVSLLLIVLLCALFYLRRRRSLRSSRLAHTIPSPTFATQFPPDLVAPPTLPPSKAAVAHRSSVASEASDTPSTQPPNYTSLYRDNSV